MTEDKQQNNGKDKVGKIGGTIFRLAWISLVVGMLLSLFNLDPRKILENFGGTIKGVFDLLVSMLEWAVPYVLLGAVLVLPIWAVMFVWRLLRNRK